MAVHVRLERRDRVDLDDGHAAAGAAGRAREPLPDPAVADDAELAAREAQVGQPVDRGERRLAGAVAVVEQVLAERVVGGDRRERRACRPPPSRAAARRRSSSPRSRRRARRRARAGARRSAPSARRRRRRRSRGSVSATASRSASNSSARGAVARVHLDPARDERGADRVLRRAGVRAGGDDLRAGVGEQRRQVGRLRLEMDDDGDAPAAQRAVGEPLAREPVEDGRVLRDPRGSAARPAERATGRRSRSGRRRPRPESIRRMRVPPRAPVSGVARG